MPVVAVGAALVAVGAALTVTWPLAGLPVLALAGAIQVFAVVRSLRRESTHARGGRGADGHE